MTSEVGLGADLLNAELQRAEQALVALLDPDGYAVHRTNGWCLFIIKGATFADLFPEADK